MWGWSLSGISPSFSTYGLVTLNGQYGSCNALTPPSNIPEIPMVVEEQWYYSGSADANTISLFGNNGQQFTTGSVGGTDGGGTPASSGSTFVQYEYWSGDPDMYLKSDVTNSILSYTQFNNGQTYNVFSYLIVNSTSAQSGWVNAYYSLNNFNQISSVPSSNTVY